MMPRGSVNDPYFISTADIEKQIAEDLSAELEASRGEVMPPAEGCGGAPLHK